MVLRLQYLCNKKERFNLQNNSIRFIINIITYIDWLIEVFYPKMVHSYCYFFPNNNCILYSDNTNNTMFKLENCEKIIR